VAADPLAISPSESPIHNVISVGATIVPADANKGTSTDKVLEEVQPAEFVTITVMVA
jgi:hypothetical protein